MAPSEHSRNVAVNTADRLADYLWETLHAGPPPAKWTEDDKIQLLIDLNRVYVAIR